LKAEILQEDGGVGPSAVVDTERSKETREMTPKFFKKINFLASMWRNSS
jgi:hypothetical protein